MVVIKQAKICLESKAYPSVLYTQLLVHEEHQLMASLMNKKQAKPIADEWREEEDKISQSPGIRVNTADIYKLCLPLCI